MSKDKDLDASEANTEARGDRVQRLAGGFFVYHVFPKPVFGAQVSRKTGISIAVQLIWLKKYFEPVDAWEGSSPSSKGFLSALSTRPSLGKLAFSLELQLSAE